MAGQGFLLKTFSFINGWVLPTNRINLLTASNTVRTLKTETKEKLKALKIPEKPKKPLTPYLQFLTEKRVIVVKDNPYLKAPQVFKKLSEDWKTVSTEQKEKYEDAYKKAKEAYEQNILKYNASLSEEQRQALVEANSEKRHDRKKRKMTKLIKETDKPKRPIGPYLLYLKEQSQIRNLSQSVLMSSLKGEWAALSETEKKKYKDQYMKENKEYESLLQKWERKMYAEGHKELIRAKTLQEIEPRPSRIIDLKKKKSHKE